MDISYESFLSSRPFSIVAPNGKKFFVHGDLIAQLSAVFSAVVNCQMQEAEKRIIDIKDVNGDIDDDTVMRFVEFAYRGDYTVPEAEMIPGSDDVDANTDSDNTETASPQFENAQDDGVLPLEPVMEVLEEVMPVEETDGWGSGYRHSSGKKKKGKKLRNNWFIEAEVPFAEFSRSPIRSSKREKLWSHFCSQAEIKHGVAWEPSSNADSRQDHTSVFLCHARLYVFSDRYQCDSLRDLTLQKLRLTLSRFQLHPERYSDITRLVQYSYDHTNTFDEGSDKLRSVVSDYVTCKFEQMASEDDFLELLPVCDGLAKDLAVKIIHRLD